MAEDRRPQASRRLHQQHKKNADRKSVNRLVKIHMHQSKEKRRQKHCRNTIAAKRFVTRVIIPIPTSSVASVYHAPEYKFLTKRSEYPDHKQHHRKGRAHNVAL